MAVICDVCSTDVTPQDDDIQRRHVVDINGKICLCTDCYIALGDYVRSDVFKEGQYKEGIV